MALSLSGCIFAPKFGYDPFGLALRVVPVQNYCEMHVRPRSARSRQPDESAAVPNLHLGEVGLGPILIFDKSTIQSLSAAEARWLTHLYYSNITPVLFLEIMADLKKIPKNERTPEQFVSGLAKKFSPINSATNVHHIEMLIRDLVLGDAPEMRGKIIMGGGQIIKDETGKTGVFFDEQPEQEAFMRWQKGEFEELERLLAERWRASLQQIDLKAFTKKFRASMEGRIDTLDLQTALLLVDDACSGRRGTRYRSLIALMESLVVPDNLRPRVIRRWKSVGGPPILEFAPFAAWCFRVNLISDLAIAYGLVRKPMESKNRVDLQYLYYLPFCDVFTSHDVFHKTLAPLLLRSDQSFVPGEELKQDLNKIDEHFRALPEKVRNTGSMNYAGYPPPNPESLTYKLWDKHVGRGWQEHAENPIEITPEISEQIMRQLKPMIDAIERQTEKK